MRSFCNAKAFLIFSTKNISVFGYNVVKHLTSCRLNELVQLMVLGTTGPRTVGVTLGWSQMLCTDGQTDIRTGGKLDPFIAPCPEAGGIKN